MARRPTPILDAWNRFKANHPVIAGRLEERFGVNHPVMAAFVGGLQESAERQDTKIVEADLPKIMENVGTAIASSGPAVSQISGEPWYENRVKVGLYIAGFGMVLKLIGIDSDWLTPERVDLITNIIIIFGAGIASVGEWLSKYLAGIDWKRPWTIFGIGRNKTPRAA